MRACVTAHPARVEAAEAAVVKAEADAKRAVIIEACRRRDKLQKLAGELGPALNALRDAGYALDAAVAAGGGGQVPALEWPGSIQMTNALQMMSVR